MSEAVDHASDRALELVRIFHPDTDRFASFASVVAKDLPPGPRTLLDHTSHMTLAMQRFHGGPVGLVVVARKDCDDGRYAREILLTAPDRRIVQYGIVRIDLNCLPGVTAAAIRTESEPLGRVLTSAGLLCDVHDVELLAIAPRPDFAAMVRASAIAKTFGRVATIALDGRPIIELLEVVTPGTA
jgi:hypothetical protein